MKTSRKRGRPLKGSHRRVRMSLTINPGIARQVRRDSQDSGLSASEVIEAALTRQENASSDAAKTLGSYARMRKQLAAIADKHKISQLSLFGSLLHGTDNPQSDIDLLVEFKAGESPGLFGLVALESELSEVFDGRKVDLRTYNDLSKYFRTAILKEAAPIYQSARPETQKNQQ